MSAVAETRELIPAPDQRIGPNGHVPEWMYARSALLAYLPAIFSEEPDVDFIGRYLMIFETIFDSLDEVVGHLPDYFHPHTAPEAFLPWLASWIDLALDEGWPLERRRAVLANAMELHRRRGTIRGLREHIELYSGFEPEVVERGMGLKLGPKSRLGHQTVLGRGDRPYHFSVILRVPDPDAVSRTRLRTIIEAQRPAHTTYALFVLPLDAEGFEVEEASGSDDSARNQGEGERT
ncbi:MAG: phage tail protein I [Thermomicrobiales bacterium]